MLHRLGRLALKTSLFLFCAASGIALAQQPERVPSGDLSDFFNPPGIKSEDAGSTTRKIGPGKKKSNPQPDSATSKSTADPTAASAVAPKTESPKSESPQPDAKGMSKESAGLSGATKASDDASETRIKIESKELEAIDGGISFGDPTVTHWRVGVVMVTGTKAVRNVVCRIPVPVQWPEQTVSVYEENLPAEISQVSWEDLGNIRFMKLRIGNVAPGEKLIATVTFNVATSQINAPKNTSIFRVPTKRTREIKPYFGDSPEISVRNTKIKKQAKLLFDNAQSDWTKIEAIFDWVRENIEERAGETKGSVEAFEKKSGTGEDRVSLFVAMCRINKVPARMVFVDGSQYAEFYLVDDKEQGHWIPCKVSGIREFGSIGEPRVILQKGDSYRVPGEKKKLKFVPAKATVKGSRPRLLKFAREPLAVK